MAKFTQGEWKYYHDGIACIYDIVAEDGQGFFNEAIAHLVTKDKDGGLSEVKANARLIASAPKMYEALKELLQYEGEGDIIIPKRVFDNARETITEVEKET